MSPLMHLMAQWAGSGTYTLQGEQIALHEPDFSPEIRNLTHARLRRMDRAYGGVLIALFLRKCPWVAQFNLYLASTNTMGVEAIVAHVEALPGAEIPAECLDAAGGLHQRKASKAIEDWWYDHRGDMHSALAEDELSDARITIRRAAVEPFLSQREIDGQAVMEALDVSTLRVCQ